MFTDGACSGNPGIGGYCAVILTKDGNKKITGAEENTTNNRMELMAVTKGLEYVKDNILKYERVKRIDVNSDSSYVVNGFVKCWIEVWKKNGWIKASGDEVKNKDLWLCLDELVKYFRNNGVSMQFIKVKGHSDNYFNELADKSAKNAINEIKKK